MFSIRSRHVAAVPAGAVAVLCLLGASWGLWSPRAWAQAAPSAEAEQLFRDGRALLAAGRTAEACAAFAGSQRLEPNPSTLMNLASCRERNGELATAWALFLQVVSGLRGDAALAATADSARAKAAMLEPRLSRLTVQVPGESRVAGLTVSRDGVAIDPATWDRAMPIDGGRYTLEAIAPGHERWTAVITVDAERHAPVIEVPRLTPIAGAGGAVVGEGGAGGVGAGGVGGEGGDVGEPRRRGGLTGKRKLAIGVGAGAVLALGAGLALELSARGTLADYEAATEEGPAREALYDDANRTHQLAQGLAIVGVAAAGVGLYCWLTGAPAAADRGVVARPIVSSTFAGLAVAGGF